jgi:hypothetical protein
MKTTFLFPNHYKIIGWILFIPSILIMLYSGIFRIEEADLFNVNVFAIYQDSIGNIPGFFKIIENNIFDELVIILSIIGGLLICFSKLKNEDEYISKIRFESLVWATYLNYAIILFFTIFVFGFTYLNVLFYNIFTLLLFFIIRFHYCIYKLNKMNLDD